MKNVIKRVVFPTGVALAALTGALGKTPVAWAQQNGNGQTQSRPPAPVPQKTSTPLQAPLTADERATVEALAREAARRVGAPYIAVDIGQTESGAWIVIETGDAQFSGVSQVPLLSLWNALRRAA